MTNDNMEDGTEGGGQDDNGVASRGLTRQSASATNLNISGISERQAGIINVSRVNALRASINRHSDAASKALLASKESLNNRTAIESAFHACRDAFMEVSSFLINMLEDRSSNMNVTAGVMKKAVTDALSDFHERNSSALSLDGLSKGTLSEDHRSYASIVRSAKPEVRVSGGPTVELTNTTSFIITPDTKNRDKYESSQETKEALRKVFKPSECGLQVNKLTRAKNNGVRIEAISPDLEQIKAHPGLAKAGLTVCENMKSNPRLIVHGVPVEMSAVEIKDELIVQNLKEKSDLDVKVIYIFKNKPNRKSTSCILEVSPAVRKALHSNGRIYLRYAACSFADHVSILQCFRCLSFGHMAKDCKSGPFCGYCAGSHEMKECKRREQAPTCINCKQRQSSNYEGHSATDAKKCPILCRKIKDKIAYINYD